MGTKANPNPNDCYDAAAEDEPIFTLRAKDPCMAEAIRYWATLRGRWGLDRLSDPKIIEALTCADAAEDWRLANPDAAKWVDEELAIEYRPRRPRPSGRPLTSPPAARIEEES